MTDNTREGVQWPDPPFVGAVYVSTRNRTGRRWEVVRLDPRFGWLIWPMGDSTLGGGVKALWKSTDDLRDRKRWRMVGVTGRA
jgi:hypothetical protein